MTPFRSIKRQLVALVAFPFIVLVAIGAATSWSTWSQRVQAERRSNLEMARAVASAFRAYAEGTREQASALGQAILLADRPATLTRLLEEAAAHRPSLRSLSWASPDGRILQSSEKAAVGISVADRRYFEAIVAGADWAVGDLVQSHVDGLLTFGIAEAIRSKEGRLVGAVVATIDPARLDDIALRLQRPGDAGIALVDQRGRLVMRTPRIELSWEERDLSRIDLVRRALSGDEAAGDTVSMSTGEPFIGAAVPIQPFGWVARAGRSRREVLAPIRRDLGRAAGVGAIAAALALAASAMAGRRIASGLRRLEGHAEQLGRGVRPDRAVEGAAELERLGRAFDEMAGRLLATSGARDRLVAEVELERRRLEDVFRAAPVGLVVLDGTTLRVRWSNETYLANLDEPYRSRGIAGLRVEEFLPGAREHGLVEIFERVARERVPYEDPELRWERFARGVTWYRWSLRPFPAPDGKGSDLLLLATDVTDLVRARLAIEAERRRLEVVLETLPIGVFIADASGRLVHSNAAARAIPGAATPLTGEGTGVTARWTDSGAAVGREDWGMARALHGEDTREGQVIDLVAGDGTVTTVVSRAAPIRDAEGRVVGGVATVQDVTAQRRAGRVREVLLETGAAVAQSLQPGEVAERIAHLAVPRLADWCMIEQLRPDGSLAVLGLAHPDPEKESRARAIHAERPSDGDRSLAARVVRTNRSLLVPRVTRADVEAVARSPAHVPELDRTGLHSLVSVPLRIRGQPIGSLTLASAESRRRFGEDDVRIAEELAREAAQAIDSARLFEDAQEAVRHRDEVLAVVSHDLRTPLATVMMSASTLVMSAERGDVSRDRVEAAAKRMQQAGERMARMVSDLLDLSALEQGRLALQAAPVQPEELVREAAEQARPVAEAKGLELGWAAAPDLPRVRADSGRILQVLGNLVSNALKAAESGFVTVQASRVGGDVRFEVADSGPGIPEADLPHVFDRFRRGRTAAYRGTGLGLAIARGIVEAHGGRIWAESRLGAGTRVFFTIPLAEGAPAQAGAPVSS